MPCWNTTKKGPGECRGLFMFDGPDCKEKNEIPKRQVVRTQVAFSGETTLM